MSSNVLYTNIVPKNYTGIIENSNKRKCWYENGLLHRLDGPAVIDSDGTKTWFKNGQLHRIDGPAVERANGAKEWWVIGKRHRLDGPADIEKDGYQAWYFEGKLHRKDGPAVIWANGAQDYYIEGIMHREDGPASISGSGDKTWYHQGRVHRVDGPALETHDGIQIYCQNAKKHRVDGPAYINTVTGQTEYWVDGVQFSEEQFKIKILRLQPNFLVILKHSAFETSSMNGPLKILKVFPTKNEAEMFCHKENIQMFQTYLAKNRFLNQNSNLFLWNVFNQHYSSYLQDFVRNIYGTVTCSLDTIKMSFTLDLWWNYEKGIIGKNVLQSQNLLNRLHLMLKPEYQFCVVKFLGIPTVATREEKMVSSVPLATSENTSYTFIPELKDEQTMSPRKYPMKWTTT